MEKLFIARAIYWDWAITRAHKTVHDFTIYDPFNPNMSSVLWDIRMKGRHVSEGHRKVIDAGWTIIRSLPVVVT